MCVFGNGALSMVKKERKILLLWRWNSQRSGTTGVLGDAEMFKVKRGCCLGNRPNVHREWSPGKVHVLGDATTSKVKRGCYLEDMANVHRG